MIAKIWGIIIGILIMAAGLYYLAKEKDNAESRKIYGTASAIGAVITVACVGWWMV